jgi:hypothetical protein
MFALLAFSSWTVMADGFKGRFPAQALQVAFGLEDNGEFNSMRTGTCFITTDYHFEQFNNGVCLHQESEKSNYLLLGDSHSAMLWFALATSMRGANVMQASTAACEPSLYPYGSVDCKKMMKYIFQSYLPSHPVQGLFVVGRWEQRDLAGLTTVIDWARQHHVRATVFGPVPEYDGPLPRLLAYSIAWHRPSLASHHLVSSLEALDAEMQSMAKNIWHVPYISLYREICNAEGCAEFADRAHSIPMMGDANHLSLVGSELVVRRLVEKGELP